MHTILIGTRIFYGVTGKFPPEGSTPVGCFPPEPSPPWILVWFCEICRWREPVRTRVLNPNATEASFNRNNVSTEKRVGEEHSWREYTGVDRFRGSIPRTFYGYEFFFLKSMSRFHLWIVALAAQSSTFHLMESKSSSWGSLAHQIVHKVLKQKRPTKEIFQEP